MVMQAMHSGKGSRVIKLFFFALLILAAGGLVLTDVGGFFNGGVSQSDVAKVGKQKISVVAFDRAVRRNLARVNIPPQQAFQMGYMDRILNGEVRRSLFQQIAEDNGIRVGRALIAKQINSMVEPQVQDGQNPQDVFEQLLMSQGFTEPEFVNIVASESAAGLLSKAVQNKYVGHSENLANDLYLYNNEIRDIEFITFLSSDFEGTKQPEHGQLEAMYNATKESYAKPESREITVAIIHDDQVKSSIEITEDRIRKIYDEEIDSYTVPQERILEQTIQNSQSDAQKIYDEASAGKSLKDAVKSVTGEETTFIAEQPFRKEGLIEEVSAPVFAAKKTGEIFGPLESPLGWHVIKLVNINQPYTKPFDNVKEQIKKELLEAELSDQKYALANEVDDMLAGGSSLEDIPADVAKLEMVTIKDVTAMGAMASKNHPLDQFGDDQAEITKLTYEFFEGESSPVTELSDGRMVVVRINKVTPLSYTPFEEVKQTLRQSWIDDNRRIDNRNHVSDILKAASVEGQNLVQVAKTVQKDTLKARELKRNEDVKSPMTDATITQIFSATQGELILIDIENGLALATVTRVALPDIAKSNDAELKTLQDSASMDAENETSTLYFESKQQNYNVRVNESVISRMYGSTDAM